MIMISAPDFLSVREWDLMSDWLIETYGRPSRRWNYYADTHTMTIYFDDQQDAVVYLLRWGGTVME